MPTNEIQGVCSTLQQLSSLPPLLAAEPIQFSYENRFTEDPPRLVLDTPSLHLLPGTVYSLYGANMSGKTTLIRVLSGHLQPRNTILYINGRPIKPHDPPTLRRAGITTCHQNDPLFPELPIWDNIRLGKPLGMPEDVESERKAKELLRAHVIERQGSKGISIYDPLGKVSGGFRTIVRLLRAVVWEFKVALLDEPTVGLDASMKELFFDVLLSRLSGSRAAVFISHIKEEHLTLQKRVAEAELNYHVWSLSNGRIGGGSSASGRLGNHNE